MGTAKKKIPHENYQPYSMYGMMLYQLCFYVEYASALSFQILAVSLHDSTEKIC